MPTDLRTTNFLGFDLVNATYAQVAAELDRLSRDDRLSLVVTPNVDHFVMLRGKESSSEITQRFDRAYQSATLRLCDSRVLQGLAWLRGVQLNVITGSDLTEMLFRGGWLDGRKVALVGGDESMLADLRARFPEVDLSQHIPPMGVLDNEPAIARIEEFLKGGDWHYILFAIGAPRSEIIAHRLMAAEGVRGVAFCIGASIEFLLGRKARAPKWMQAARLEWAFRLATEPRRLWRRYLLSGPKIIAIVREWQRP
jgi:N-acetylglucosaminyldiphosphoundecaprenol N-acetyl-beta-D-mannosaminyltransferase